MPEPIIFPFADYWSYYVFFCAFVLVVLVIDLGIFHRKSHAVSFKEAAIWSIVWISLALVFSALLYYYCLVRFPNDAQLMAFPGFEPEAEARRIALEFLTGFVVEKSLAVDNLFVFVVVFGFFGIPAIYQHRILFYGILGALIFRGIFIALGAVLMDYEIVVLIFGLFLIVTGIKMMFQPEKQIDPSKNYVIRALRRYLPISDAVEGDRFWLRKDGRWVATPLFVALVFLEMTDIIFAVDSVPAIFAITKEPFIVFTSNIFAILGLRALYFLLAGVIDKFHLLKYGLAIVLIFVGLKMVWLNEWYGGKFPISYSLGIICGVISASILLSFLIPQRSSAERSDH